jgi:hypothetical protein
MELWTEDEFAKHCRFSKRKAERDRAAGTGCPFVKLGRRVLYRAGDVEAWIAGNLRHSTSGAL